MERQAVELAGNTGTTPRVLRLALAQINSTVGDLAGNVRRMQRDMERAAAAGADIVAFPELALTGYPPEDLLLKPGFVNDNLRALDDLTQSTTEFQQLAVVTGFVDRETDLYNAAAVLYEGKRAGVYHKHYLPTYSVFDEDRYFRPGERADNFVVAGVNVGINICEDIWYSGGPPAYQAYAGAELLLNISASPYYRGKQIGRERMLATRAADTASIVAYVNMVGAQDELVFDGMSVIFDASGELVARAAPFDEDLLIVDLDVDAVFRTRLHDPRRRKERLAVAPAPEEPIVVSGTPRTRPAQELLAPRVEALLDPVPEVYRALTLGTRDYMRKNGFRGAVVGLSGGIDSALTAAIAVDAVGAQHVWGVAMPSRYSTEHSRDDARELATNLGIEYLTLPIEDAFAAIMGTLADSIADAPSAGASLASENVQARIRGILLMALSNSYGSIVLATGNKSEMAVGYATLYGDMAGGFAVLKDVYKTLVYQLARWKNESDGREVIPQHTITKAPSAELRPGQLDTDSLPPYDILDGILAAYVEQDRDVTGIVQLGYDPATVRTVLKMVDRSEYKRRQAAPGVKITQRAFGRDRRLPITNTYREPAERTPVNDPARTEEAQQRPERPEPERQQPRGTHGK